MNKKLFILFAFAIIGIFIIMHSVSAASWIQNVLTTDLTGTGSQTNLRGEYVKFTSDATAITVTVDSQSTATYMFLYDDSGHQLANASVSGLNTTLNYSFTNGTNYYILFSSNGASYTEVGNSLTQPVTGSTLTFLNGGTSLSSGGTSITPTQDSNIAHIILQIWTINNILSPVVNLNSPNDNYYSNKNYVTFNATVKSINSAAIQNVSLYTNISGSWAVTSTNTSGYNNTNYIFNETDLSDGTYLWNIRSCTTTSDCQFNSSNRTFTVDTINPIINITNPYPNNTLIDYQIANQNLQLNWTVNDTHLSSCWYSLNGGITNTSVTCSANTTNINITSPSINNVTFYANDTAGNLASLERSWGYKVFQNSVNYTSSTLSGATETFILNITIDPSLSLGTSYLVYNGTAYLGTVSTSGANKIITSSINIPTVSTATNVTFYWNNTLSDGSTITTNSYNQTINPFLIGSCGTYSNQLYNFTIYDEGDQHKLANTTTEALFNLYSSDGSTLIANYSMLSTSNPTLICSNIAIPVGVSYSLDGTVKYTSNESSYDTEYYNILSYSLTNSSANQNIALYSLLSADETDFQVTVTGQNFLPVQNAIIYVQRQYVSQNKFITVEAPKTDSNGQTILHLVRNSVTYNLIVQNATNGTIITQLDNILAYCSDPTTTSCIINLNAFTSSTLPETYNNIIGLAYSGPTYNTTSRVVTFGFTTTDSTAKNVTMKVLKYDQIGNTTACTNSLTSASGTLSCNVPSSIGSSSITINIYVDGTLVLTNIITGQGSNLGESGYVFVFFLMIMLVLMAAGDKNVTLIVLIIGLVIATGIAVINGSVLAIGSSVGFAIIAIGILLWKLNKDKQD